MLNTLIKIDINSKKKEKKKNIAEIKNEKKEKKVKFKIK